MYLATVTRYQEATFEIRQSIRQPDGGLTHRTVFDLGPDPTSSFQTFEEFTVLYSDSLLKAVSAASEEDPEPILENLLWDYLPGELRRRSERFHNKTTIILSPLSADEHASITREIHLFDRRRLYFIRYGAIDQSRLGRMHDKCCRPLLGQSRDEREYWFQAEERSLRIDEYHRYVYAIFNLQKFFTQSFAPWFPEALVWNDVADNLEEEICRLNRDSFFWQGIKPQTYLHPHLQRYLVKFFDYSPASHSFQRDFAREFMNSHRQFRWPASPPSPEPEKVGNAFGVPYETLKKMSLSQLTKLFRQRAKMLHPDKGGDHELFVTLSKAYDGLRKKR